MAAKSAKGDTDTIPLHPRKKVTGSGWRSWQQPEDDDGDADAAVEYQESGATNDEDDSEGESQYGQGSTERSTGATPQQSQSPRGVRAGSRGVGRPRGGRRRTQTKARAIGGLFRDYRPSIGDENGADIRASIPDITPRTWGELGVPAAAVGAATMQTTSGMAGAEAETGDGNWNGNENGEMGAETKARGPRA
ncbi:MAG: hypothetical protein Q9187_006440 [Circinaria calcarea]